MEEYLCEKIKHCHVKTTTTVKFSHTLAQERANTDSGPENVSSLAQEKDDGCCGPKLTLCIMGKQYLTLHSLTTWSPAKMSLRSKGVFCLFFFVFRKVMLDLVKVNSSVGI